MEGAHANNPQCCPVGKFLKDRPINVGAMKSTLASLWRPVKGVSIQEIHPNLFLFQFLHELDMNKVIKGGPWTFDSNQLLTKVLGEDDNPSSVFLDTADIWVQVYDLPTGLRSERVIQNIGNFVGVFVESDQKNLDGNWRQFMRIRVSMDVRKPLRGTIKKQARGERSRLSFQI